MSTEVELKAWVDDMASLRARVAARYAHEGSFVKEDVYYRLGGAASVGEGVTPAAASDPGAIEFRLRIDGEAAYVTAKRKSITDGVEVNDEMEYRVSDAASFERFAEYLGAAVFARKRKSGDRYRAGAATVELAHVDRLGDFIEIERLVDDALRIEEAGREVRRILDELGIPPSKIESRYYIDMLAALGG